MAGKYLLWVAKQHGHGVSTMLTTYAAWTEGATDADVEAIKRAMEQRPRTAQIVVVNATADTLLPYSAALFALKLYRFPAPLRGAATNATPVSLPFSSPKLRVNRRNAPTTSSSRSQTPGRARSSPELLSSIMLAQVVSYFKRAFSMIFPLIAIPFGRIQLYQKPISMRFGERKLTQLCCQELGREPKVNELFLFYNTKRDTLKLFWRDGNRSQEITKALPRGGFMLPAPKDGEAFVTLARSKLESVFRTGKK